MKLLKFEITSPEFKCMTFTLSNERDCHSNVFCIFLFSLGIFKIEDSARVARLWGQRKNRPAMNYDKLSRSIRQYYKKGIIKKTEQSKRLVYQFCEAYLWDWTVIGWVKQPVIACYASKFIVLLIFFGQCHEHAVGWCFVWVQADFARETGSLQFWTGKAQGWVYYRMPCRNQRTDKQTELHNCHPSLRVAKLWLS